MHTKLQVNQLYEECIVAAKKVLVEIEERLLIETNESKMKLLEHILLQLKNIRK